MQPAFGALSDRIGRKNNMIAFGALAALGSVPILYAVGSAPSATAACAYVLVGLVVASFYTSISGVVKAELFPPEVRALGVGLPYAIGNAVFGGTAEYVALWTKSVGHETAFYGYVSAVLAVAFAISWLLPRNAPYLRHEH
jgi:MHS family dicarboxylic acid transporter PcaT-like MFS transporter